MKHLAAYMLLKLGGNENPSKDDVKKALSIVGIDVDEAKLEKLLASLEGKDLNELLKEGRDMLADFGSSTDVPTSNASEVDDISNDDASTDSDNKSFLSVVDEPAPTLFEDNDGDY